MPSLRTHAAKYLIAMGIVVAARLLPHPPNVEPITATLMPFAKVWGGLPAALFGALAVVAYDALTGTIGPWSLFTLGAYVLLGLLAGVWFRFVAMRGLLSYAGFAIVGTLFFDAITGLTVGPLFFRQSLAEAFVGQIPFTLYHLAGNIVLSVTLSPLIERWVVKNALVDRLVGAPAHA